MSVANDCATPLPLYICHKEVWALKIGAIGTVADKILIDAPILVITPADPRYAPFEAPTGCAERFKGSAEDLGYYVVYKDGYASWSPSKAFEEGYTRA